MERYLGIFENMRLNLENITLVIILFLGVSVNFFFTEARMVRTFSTYVLGEYVEVERITSFSFPASITTSHVGAYLWIEDLLKLKEGILPKGLNLVYLDAHPDWEPGHQEILNSGNWVACLLSQPNWIRNANYVMPPWFSDELIEITKRYISTHNAPITSYNSVNSLPSGEKLGPIILSIDFDYFSNDDEGDLFTYKPENFEKIKEKVDEIIRNLKEKDIQVAALNFAISYDCTFPDDIPVIKSLLMETFKEYDEWIQSGEQL